MNNSITQIRAIADYQFFRGLGLALFPDEVEFTYSKTTKKIRTISLKGERLATLRPTDGRLSLSLFAANFICKNLPSTPCFITVRNDVAQFIANGGDVFSVHVVKTDNAIRSKDEVIVINENKIVLAVGRALLSSKEISSFKTGVAVKVRHGSKQH